MKTIKLIILTTLLVMLCGCVEPNTNETTQEHTGKCLEYATEYKLECGIFTCSDSWCCERKYDVCVRWEE